MTLRKENAKETYTGAGADAAAGGSVSVTDPALANGTGSTASPAPSAYGKDDVKEEYGVTRQVEKATTAPGALKRMTVAVVLDDKVQGLTNKNVQDLVANAVGLDTTRGDTISVAAAPFPADAAAAAGGAASAAAAGPDYVRYGTLGLAGFVLLVITLTLLRAARRGTVNEIPLSDLALEPVDHTPVLEAAASRALDRAEADQDLKVLELVDSRPDEVSALIRSWLVEPVEAGKK